MTDWPSAGLVGGVGFATVFVVLAVLATVVYVLGLAIRRQQRGREQNSSK